MFKITVILRGQAVDPAHLADALESAFLESVCRDFEERIVRALGSDANQITATLTGNDIENLKLTLSGPDEIVEKANRAI